MFANTNTGDQSELCVLTACTSWSPTASLTQFVARLHSFAFASRRSRAYACSGTEVRVFCFFSSAGAAAQLQGSEAECREMEAGEGERGAEQMLPQEEVWSCPPPQHTHTHTHFQFLDHMETKERPQDST